MFTIERKVKAVQHLKPETFKMLEKFINDYSEAFGGRSPTVEEIADGVGLAKSTVSKYLNRMKEDGLIRFEGHRSIATKRMLADAEGFCRVPVLGRVACGLPILAEENIEEYVRLPASLFGSSDIFILRAKGDSMINAGIDDGDLVVIKQQNTAEYNQIVVALVGEDATLKRFRPDGAIIRLHPENPAYDDIIVESCLIQGVAVKLIKDIR